MKSEVVEDRGGQPEILRYTEKVPCERGNASMVPGGDSGGTVLAGREGGGSVVPSSDGGVMALVA
ncbi:hypothetical protein E2562_029187 [Oryza meyeriana var. granulata]|uniref:Uncharacterized protein n=1 Tax=Oryza meyeriana var. granulata TaxID=110450 RepID=A0A6G1BZV2_9ORYZ|nr:hypothetical protein E2562_029187 [Oryza meyeriana var. granulata]